MAEDACCELDRIKELGLKGVKLHNDYQGVFIFDEHCIPIYKRCEELGLPVVFHMGYDPVSPRVHRAMPYDLLELHENFPKLKIIGAHMGGEEAWESVYHYVAGVENIWLDTAFTAGIIDEKLFYEIVKKIYSNKEILLSNWIKAEYMTNSREYIVVMPFIDTEKLNKLGMFYKNNPNVNRKIDIITLKENKEKICEILTNKVNIVELDNWLGGIIDGKREEN